MKTYTLAWNDFVEELTADELLKKFEEVEAKGWHIEESKMFDFMVCFW